MQFSKSITAYGQNQKLNTIDIEQNLDFSRVDGILGHPNQHAFGVGVLLFITLPYVIKSKNKFFYFILILAGINIVLSQSRTIWISVIITFLLWYRKEYKSLHKTVFYHFHTKSFAIAIILIGLFFLVIFPRIQISQLFFSDDGGGALRIRMMKEGWELLQESPWFGFGSDNSIKALLSSMSNGYIGTFPFPPHFVPLQIALESGIPGGISFFLPFYFLLRILVKYRNSLLHIEYFSIMSCYTLLCIMYIMQPVYGRRDFFFVSLILAFGVTKTFQVYEK